MPFFTLSTTYPPEQQNALKTAFWALVSILERVSHQTAAILTRARVITVALYLSLYLYILLYYIFIYINTTLFCVAMLIYTVYIKHGYITRARRKKEARQRACADVPRLTKKRRSEREYTP